MSKGKGEQQVRSTWWFCLQHHACLGQFLPHLPFSQEAKNRNNNNPANSEQTKRWGGGEHDPPVALAGCQAKVCHSTILKLELPGTVDFVAFSMTSMNSTIELPSFECPRLNMPRHALGLTPTPRSGLGRKHSPQSHTGRCCTRLGKRQSTSCGCL